MKINYVIIGIIAVIFIVLTVFIFYIADNPTQLDKFCSDNFRNDSKWDKERTSCISKITDEIYQEFCWNAEEGKFYSC